MFEALKRVANNVKQLDEKKIAVRIFKEKEVQTFIIDLNILDQLLKGVDSEGKSLGYYSAATDSYTQGETFTYKGYSFTKRAGNPIRLFDTGDFYKSFTVLVNENGFTIEADDEKEDGYLSDRYGLEILGLRTESKNELAKEILDKVIKLVREQISK